MCLVVFAACCTCARAQSDLNDYYPINPETVSGDLLVAAADPGEDLVALKKLGDDIRSGKLTPPRELNSGEYEYKYMDSSLAASLGFAFGGADAAMQQHVLCEQYVKWAKRDVGSFSVEWAVGVRWTVRYSAVSGQANLALPELAMSGSKENMQATASVQVFGIASNALASAINVPVAFDVSGYKVIEDSYEKIRAIINDSPDTGIKPEVVAVRFRPSASPFNDALITAWSLTCIAAGDDNVEIALADYGDISEGVRQRIHRVFTAVKANSNSEIGDTPQRHAFALLRRLGHSVEVRRSPGKPGQPGSPFPEQWPPVRSSTDHKTEALFSDIQFDHSKAASLTRESPLSPPAVTVTQVGAVAGVANAGASPTLADLHDENLFVEVLTESQAKSIGAPVGVTADSKHRAFVYHQRYERYAIIDTGNGPHRYGFAISSFLGYAADEAAGSFTLPLMAVAAAGQSTTCQYIIQLENVSGRRIDDCTSQPFDTKLTPENFVKAAQKFEAIKSLVYYKAPNAGKNDGNDDSSRVDVALLQDSPVVPESDSALESAVAVAWALDRISKHVSASRAIEELPTDARRGVEAGTIRDVYGTFGLGERTRPGGSLPGQAASVLQPFRVVTRD